ncbi:mediator of RNA polymerase II transcription subunit 23-like protein [Trifolium pratense]|uniref:Mediator of RNA polymerase II transcription subunit 23-like protein n=1 Tax=Trifolium pratense TaxID=57577 RepID=A0A2K3NIA7_TRIPR|nr:mediator of RNA polymerase II transcription subunit 23-like protein [Trifolium pratense]
MVTSGFVRSCPSMSSPFIHPSMNYVECKFQYAKAVFTVHGRDSPRYRRVNFGVVPVASIFRFDNIVDVFGKNSQTSIAVDASEIADIIDFLHHVIHYEGQGGPVQASSKPRPDILALLGRAAESLRPEFQHLLSHLNTDVNSSVYASSHPKLVPNPT